MTETTEAVAPALNLKFLSHGTLESRDLEASRAYYEQFLGLDVIRTSNISLMIRLGGNHVYAVVENKKADNSMTFLNHNGLDVLTEAEVDECHRLCEEQAERWGMTKISKPRVQHGTYSFYFWDLDGNAWEILCNPAGGYVWLFEEGEQEGRGHFAKDFERPSETIGSGD
jgi:catechol 2,3-dioxygenase-like lactoylglutathione lyase family enzyme